MRARAGGRRAAEPHPAPVRRAPERGWQVRGLPRHEEQCTVPGVRQGHCRAAAGAHAVLALIPDKLAAETMKSKVSVVLMWREGRMSP